MAGKMRSPESFKLRYKSVCLLLGALFSIVPVGLHAQENSISPQLKFHHFGPEQGLLSQEIAGVARDSKGFVWVATYAGLFRYDGYRFKQFIHDSENLNSLSGNRLRSVVVDKKDRVWVGTESNGVTMYDPSDHTFRRYGNNPEDPADYFAGQTLFIEELADGSMVFMVFGDGMVRLMPDMETLRRHKHDALNPESLSSNLCLAADVDLEGSLWVACLGGDLQRYNAVKATFTSYEEVYGVDTDAPLDHVTVIQFERDGTLWMGTDGIGLIRKETSSPELLLIKPGAAPYQLTPGFVTKLMEDRNGDIWVGYRDRGIDVLEWQNQSSSRVQHVSGRASSLSSNNTFAVTQDDDGLIWVPTWGAGLNVVDPGNVGVSVYQSDPGAPGIFASNSNIRMLLELDDGRWLLSSRDKRPSIFYRDGDALILEKSLDLVPGDNQPFWVISAIQGSDRRIWLPTVGRGLYIYDLEQESARMVPGTEGWNLVSIFEDQAGTIWLSEFSRGVFTIDPHTLTLESAAIGISGVSPADLGPVLVMLENTDQTIWIGTRSGVFRLSPDRRQLSRVRSMSAEEGQDRMRSARAMTIDRKGRLWIAGEQISYTSEPFASEPEFVFPFDGTPYRSLASNTVLEDGTGRMWFSTAEGVLAFDPETRKTVFFGDNMNGPVNVPDRGGHVTESGELVYAGLRRLTILSPSIFDHRKTVKAPEVTRLVVGGREIFDWAASDLRDAADIELTPDDRDFTVEYASLTPIDAASYTYAHRLEGFDKEWTYTDSSRRSATYTNLPPGGYTLYINVFDRNGNSSTYPSEIRLEVLPAFYQTIWFQFLAIAVGFLALFALYQGRLAVLKASQRKLEEQVVERTEKIERQRSELAQRNVKIERTMSELKETQSKLIQSEKLAALGGLVAGVAHEVNTPIGLVVSGASQIESEVGKIRNKLAGEQITKPDLERFLELSHDLGRLTLNNAQKAADMIQSFKLVSADQTSQQITDIQLVPYLRDVMISVKPLLMEKGHVASVTGDEKIRLLINAGALSQVVTNLVTNAVTHAFGSGESGDIRIDAAQTSDATVVTVADNGKGISAINQEKIFEPFFTTRRGQGNTGLGLHIVHNLVVGALSGTVEYRRPEEGGSVFTITIPRK